MSLIIAAGGTGGHIMPALAVGLAFRERGGNVVWFGDPDKLEAQIAKQHGIPFVPVKVTGIRPMKELPYRLWRIGSQIKRASDLILEHQGSVVFSTGSYASFAVAMGSVLAKVPLVLHEQNSLVGLANKVLMPFAHQIYLGMPVRGLPRSWVVGNPLCITPKPSEGDHILIFAGSQGSRYLNEKMPWILSNLKCTLPIIHIAGQDQKSVEKAYQQCKLQATVYDFVNDMDLLYQKTRIAVCRSGAMTLSELNAYQIPSILVPYPHAKRDHQRRNAEAFSQSGGAIVVFEDMNVIESALGQALEEKTWASMRLALEQSKHLDAAKTIVNGMIKIGEAALSH